MKYLGFLFLFLSFSLSAQFPNLMWEYPLGAPAFGSAAAADLDQDGFYEIVFTTYTNDATAHCLNAEDGSVHWTFDIGGCGDVAPLIYDMNQDGNLDVIVNGSCNPTIFCIDGLTGDLIWSKASGGGDSPPTVADIDEDGKPEVLFGNFNGEVRVLNGEDGSTAKIIQAEPNGGALQTEPTVLDVNNDGHLDIIAANFFNDDGLFVWAYNYEDGSLIWEHEDQVPDADFHAYHSGAVADIDNDELPEYVIGSGAGFVLALNLEDGSELWKREVSASNMGAISIADLDDDSQLEVVFNNNDYLTFDDRIWVLNGLDGSEEWSFPITFSSFRGMSISDINGNGQLDLVSGHFMGRLRAVEPYNGLIWEVNLMDYFTEDFPWFEVDHQPLIADFDQNGTMDVFAVAGYGTYIPDSINTGGAFMFEAGEGECPEWLMFRQDVLRTGYLSEQDIQESCNLSSTQNQPIENTPFKISPNPMRGNGFVDFELNESGMVYLKLFDIRGIQIQEINLDNLSSGVHQIPVNFQDLSGIYFVELYRDGVKIGVKKIVVE